MFMLLQGYDPYTHAHRTVSKHVFCEASNDMHAHVLSLNSQLVLTLLYCSHLGVTSFLNLSLLGIRWASQSYELAHIQVSLEV